ncbi:P-II family nitrogen regulator [Papillibacter cinnamivorans]|uniref:Nitrogen regulatory protein P-II family n=1 Tax=Papillibacter cinnamivorans DSM 12816 TaxID=1122930 RepID=A0A1W2CVS2_9FIRM|nr:P-II family nitrogen regulator [Papillibacter cinnamivorans]SMC88818.1 nitrogen regulatory protein P-II family [Papillibacter cinnamivorans DSM 12816]
MDKCESHAADLLCVIVGCGQGSRVLHIAKKCGVAGGTVFLGMGTVRGRLLELLSLCDARKEIVLMAAPPSVAENAFETLGSELKLKKHNHGIAFVLPLNRVIGARSCGDADKNVRKENDAMYQAITVIVDKGKAEEVIAAAEKAGSAGGTVINARGAGVHETGRLFSMEIEPEKEIVLILSRAELAEAIVSSVRSGLRIDEPGRGIIFVQDVAKTCGLYE